MRKSEIEKLVIEQHEVIDNMTNEIDSLKKRVNELYLLVNEHHEKLNPKYLGGK